MLPSANDYTSRLQDATNVELASDNFIWLSAENF